MGWVEPKRICQVANSSEPTPIENVLPFRRIEQLANCLIARGDRAISGQLSANVKKPQPHGIAHRVGSQTESTAKLQAPGSPTGPACATRQSNARVGVSVPSPPVT